MKTLFHIVFILLFINSYSQINFQEHIVIDDTNSVFRPIQVYATDIDGDGYTDALFSADEKHRIGWFKNMDGQGNYGDLIEIISENETTGSYHIYPSDVDNDGDVDIVCHFIASYNGDKRIVWYKNTDGLGSFSDEILIKEYDEDVAEVIIDDVDNDGDTDIIYSTNSNKKLAWIENEDGLGTNYIEHVITENTMTVYLINAADIDTDGDDDIIFRSSSSESLFWFENTDGLGNFTGQHFFPFESYHTFPQVFSDIDNDGDIDIVSLQDNNYSNYKSILVWNENLDGNGSFGTSIEIISDPKNFTSVRVYDVDQDGSKDIVINSGEWVNSSYTDFRISLYKNLDGNGNFGSEILVSGDCNKPIFTSLNDLDSNGTIDILLASYMDNKLGWFKNIDGQGTFDKQKIITTSADGVRFVSTGDINGNDTIDIISAQYSTRSTTWYENVSGQGDFGLQQTVPYFLGDPKVSLSVDMDGDGDNDILTRYSYSIVWFENVDGNGNFEESHLVVSFDHTTSALYYGDMDGDGDMDVLSSSNSNNMIAWYENMDGLGTFGTGHIIFIWGVGAETLYSADIDGDNDLDVMSASTEYNRIVWYENLDGIGNFSGQKIISMNSNNVSIIDVDNDGDIDVLSLSTNDETIGWYENQDGLGNFGDEHIISETADQVYKLYAADIDIDGDADILFSSNLTHTINWYENTDGLGSFDALHTIPTLLDENYRINTADIDADGDTDIICAIYQADTVTWLENLSPLKVNEKITTHFSIYPNPTSDQITIKSAIRIATISVYNQLGESLLSNNEKNSIDISMLNNGIYYIEIKDLTGNIEVHKVIKK